jgi:hypothetical protein
MGSKYIFEILGFNVQAPFGIILSTCNSKFKHYLPRKTFGPVPRFWNPCI